MKTAKKVLAIFLCIALLCGIGATNTFAAEIGDEIKWTYVYDDGEEYYYYHEFGGTLTEGENTITNDTADWAYKAYEFEAAQAGYYYFDSYYWLKVAESYQNGEAVNNADYEWLYSETAEDEYDEGKIYYLPEGTALIVAETYSYEESYINIEYLGDITEINFDEEELGCIILGEDTYYVEEENYVEFYAPYTVSFSNGKVLGYDGWVAFETNGTFAKGENALKFSFLNYETDVYATFYEITDFVESIELQKHDMHLDAKYYYDGCIEYFDLGDKPEYVTVNFTDGTSKTFEFYYGPSYTNNTITLPNGKEVYAYAYLDYNEDGEICFVAGMAGHYFIEEPCQIEAASFSENLDHLKENISDWLDWYANDIRYYISEMAWAISVGNFTYFINYFGWLFGTSEYLSYIINEVTEFISYSF